MNETAAHLVHDIIGEVPVRHWVCTVPPPLRYLLAYNTSLSSAVLQSFVHSIFAWQKHLAKKEFGLRSVLQVRPAAVTMVHRASGHLALNVHFHSLVADGVYIQESPQAPPEFRALPAPSRGDVTSIAWQTCNRTIAVLRKEGLWLDVDPADDRFAQEEPGLAQCCAASLQGVLLFGKNSGKRLMRIRGEAACGEKEFEPQGQVPGFGFSVHAERRVSAKDRKGLEQLARYATRPAVAGRRLKLLASGKVVLELKRQWSDGTSHFVFEPLDFMGKLAALIWPPRTHRTRYHGAWGRRSKLRELVRPKKLAPSECEHVAANHSEQDSKRQQRIDWASLIARVFRVDVLECPRCKAQMQRIAWITRPDAIRAILSSVGLPGDSPRVAPARWPIQEEMFVA